MNVPNIQTVNIARNVLKHVNNVLKNAEKWQHDNYYKGRQSACLFSFLKITLWNRIKICITCKA
jgi:hypothetical protein